MANTVERRRTVTRSYRTPGANELKDNISNIAEEIARVRDQAREEVSALEKIRGMLDVGYLNELMESIESFQERIEELESATLQSTGEIDRYRRELEQEQDRLAKLWDAYKVQEDELARLKRDYPLMEEKLFERERTIEGLRRDLAELEPLARYQGEYEALRDKYDELQSDMADMEGELEKANRTIAGMEYEMDSLRALEGDARRAEQLTKELEEERERLAKLYRVYEDLEGEKKELDDRVALWEKWFKEHSPGFRQVQKGVDAAPLM